MLNHFQPTFGRASAPHSYLSGSHHSEIVYSGKGCIDNTLKIFNSNQESSILIQVQNRKNKSSSPTTPFRPTSAQKSTHKKKLSKQNSYGKSDEVFCRKEKKKNSECFTRERYNEISDSRPSEKYEIRYPLNPINGKKPVKTGQNYQVGRLLGEQAFVPFPLEVLRQRIKIKGICSQLFRP